MVCEANIAEARVTTCGFAKAGWPLRWRAVLMVSAASIALGGCYGDPYQNPGDWSANGVARENIAQQAADKSDLLAGQGDGLSSGVAAAAGVNKALGGAAGTAAGLQTVPPALSENGAGN